jgi:formylglycine-generating enzyme required for sulfatase activity
MHRLVQSILLLSIAIFLLAATPYQEQPPTTPTPAPFDTCLTDGFPECIPNVLRAYGLWAILLLGIFIVAIIFLRVEIQNWVGGWKKLRKKDADDVFNRWEVSEVTRDYLVKVIEDYRCFKFRGLDTRSRGIETPELDQAYISIQMVPEAERRNIPDSKASPEEIEVDSTEADQGQEETAFHKIIASDAYAPMSLVEAIGLTPKLAVIGGAGSGKSTLLQWAGLACARAVVEPAKLTPEQATFTQAAGEKPLLPVLIPLRAFNRDCIDKQKKRTASTLLEFITASIVEKHPALKLPVDFFAIHLRQKGCLMMFDGVDEVDPDERVFIREAIEDLVKEFKNNPRNRYLVTSRTVAYFGTAEVSGFRKCLVQNLTPDQRDLLIRNWCLAAYGGDEAVSQSGDLCHRIDTSDERVRVLAITPLMVTIFALVHYDRRELPRQRAELYEHAVRILLTEPYKEGEAAAELKKDWETRRNRLAFIAFEMHAHKLDELLEDDMVDLIWREFGTPDQEKLARQAGRDFVRRIADRGGLLEEENRRYGFFTHRTFREFLAGRYLAEERTAEEQTHFLVERLDQDTWIEPVRLAAGYLAIYGESRANQFIRLLADLGNTPEQRVQALTLAGLAISDLPPAEPPSPKRIDLTQKTVDEMVARLSDNPPRVQLPLRRELGLALGELGDPRLNPLEPKMVPVHAGPFRMGTSTEDQGHLKAQEIEFWPDELPDHMLELPEFQIGKYPVTNAEFRLFFQQNGYNDQFLWSPEGWKWRMGTWESNLAGYSKGDQKFIRDWLARRPPDRRDRPFYWDNQAWNGDNLPVVGVCWFEAQAYCNWLSHSTGRSYRLPTEAEWEKAARGREGHLWPWGDEWDALKCNCTESNEVFRGTTSVGMYPDGASPDGTLDMVGNVWEWTSSLFKDYPYNEQDGRQDSTDPGFRVLRGGSWHDLRSGARCACRLGGGPDLFDYDIGFRLLLSPK